MLFSICMKIVLGIKKALLASTYDSATDFLFAKTLYFTANLVLAPFSITQEFLVFFFHEIFLSFSSTTSKSTIYRGVSKIK
ncbi:hypothetical protein D3C85_1509230 [compost metagenome]